MSGVFFLCLRKPLIATVEKQLLGEHLSATLQKGTQQYTLIIIVYMSVITAVSNCHKLHLVFNHPFCLTADY